MLRLARARLAALVTALARTRALVVLALAALVAGFAVGGMILAQRVAGPSVRSFALGTAEISVGPATSGAIDAYVPIVDWGVRARPFDAPIAVSLRFRSLDRDAAVDALRSGDAARAELDDVGQDLESLVRAELQRSALIALAGAAVGGLLLGALLSSRRGRRWLVIGPAGGLATALVAIGLIAFDISRADYREAIEEPTFYAKGEELPELLDFSSQLLTVSNRYTESFDEVAAGLTNLVAAASGGNAVPQTARTIVLASDIHSNTFVLPVLARYAQGRPIFLAGDFSQLGSRFEEGIVPGVASLGRTIVAVSGNHDSRTFMRALAAAGVTVLTREGRLRPDGTTDGERVVEIAGLTVAGFDDPLERQQEGVAEYLRTEEPPFDEEGRKLVDWFASLPERPDIVMVHRHGLAHVLLDYLEEQGGPPVTILTGHDHEAHYHEAGPHLLLDGGSAGAGGAFAIGEESAGFALLHLDGRLRPLALDLIQVEPLSQEGSVQHVVLEREPEAEPTAAGGRSETGSALDRP